MNYRCKAFEIFCGVVIKVKDLYKAFFVFWYWYDVMLWTHELSVVGISDIIMMEIVSRSGPLKCVVIVRDGVKFEG